MSREGKEKLLKQGEEREIFKNIKWRLGDGTVGNCLVSKHRHDKLSSDAEFSHKMRAWRCTILIPV